MPGLPPAAPDREGAATLTRLVSCHRVRTIPLILLALAAPLAAKAQNGPLTANAQNGPDISGSWLRDDGTARVSVVRCGAQICATNIWVKESSKDEAVGDQFVMSLTPQGQSSLAGFAYDVRRDRNYSLQISVQDDRMQTRGCLSKGLLCKSMTWVRAR
jgi:uncharacterized protein (DUF2147 family)